MTNANMREGETSSLRIEGEMTIYRALELKQALLARLESSAAVEVDLAGVTEIDTAGVQLLMLAAKSAQAGNRELRLVAPSPAVAEVLKFLNLETVCGDPLPIPSTSGASR